MLCQGEREEENYLGEEEERRIREENPALVKLAALYGIY
jgi:hypothetical protein